MARVRIRLCVIAALLAFAVNAATASAQNPTPTPTSTAQPPASPPQSSKVFNPDISVIGNFVGVAGRNPMSTQPPLQMSEAEVAFQAVVDPYARADFYLSAGPDGLSIEEGFLTFTTLPGQFLVKVGQLRGAFGKVNTLHTHAMPSVDRPLVTENLVGGEEGISDAGISVSRLIPVGTTFVEATGEVLRGNSAVFQTASRSRLNYLGRLRAYRDITESTNIDVGTSYALGPTDLGIHFPDFTSEPARLDRQLVGVDATFRYRPLRRALYRRFQARTELIWSRQDLPGGAQTRAFGFYGLGEYQFARRWYAGGRVDRSARSYDAALRDTGGSVFITFWPSEFSQIRGQYRWTNYAEGIGAHEFLFQFNFAIGAHGAHVF
ncbi:MAG TPA: hypothetical protein VFV78_01115 [Vicinamibacterales bacterium]|nr:hypothetical protein [Vicinamibacterales bacterium]